MITKYLEICIDLDDAQRVLDLTTDNQLHRIPAAGNKNRGFGIVDQAGIASRLNQPEKTAEVVKNISESKNK